MWDIVVYSSKGNATVKKNEIKKYPIIIIGPSASAGRVL